MSAKKGDERRLDRIAEDEKGDALRGVIAEKSDVETKQNNYLNSTQRKSGVPCSKHGGHRQSD